MAVSSPVPDESRPPREQFAELLRRYYDSRHGGDGRLDAWAQGEHDALTVDYADLHQYDPDLAREVRRAPDTMLTRVEEALREYDLPADGMPEPVVELGGLEAVHDADTFDIGEFPAERDDELVVLEGLVKKVAQPMGEYDEIAWECQRCGTPTTLPGDAGEPHECSGCERQGPFEIRHGDSETRKVQTVRLQRPPERTDAGQQAPDFDVDLHDHLVHDVSPGERVRAATVLRPKTVTIDDGEDDRYGFEFAGEVNAVEHEQTDFSDLDYEQHIDEIEALGAQADVRQQIVDSIHPTHHGDEEIKLAIALQMFGGVEKDLPDGSSIRGQSHLLLVGDPGVDKSGLIRRATELTPRSVYTSGKNATAAGLTCAAVQDDFGDGGWTLEAGALVQAHGGLCAIDEFDKMEAGDRDGVHEALSEGTISPSKASISNVTLPAQTTVLAAANPRDGRFDPYEPVGKQIDIGSTLISRFDLIFTLQDEADPEADAELAAFLSDVAHVGQQLAAGDEPDADLRDEAEPAVDPELLRNYVAYAKEEITPVMTDAAKERFKNFYVSVREEGVDEDSPIPVTARKLEALHRLGEAAARLRLSERVEAEDADLAIGLVESCLNDVGVDPETDQYDADMVETGQSKTQRDRVKLVKAVIDDLQHSTDQGAPHEAVFDACTEEGMNRHQIDKTLTKLKDKGEVYEPASDHYRPT